MLCPHTPPALPAAPAVPHCHPQPKTELTVTHFCGHHQLGPGKKTSTGRYTHAHIPIGATRESTSARAGAAGAVPGWHRSAR